MCCDGRRIVALALLLPLLLLMVALRDALALKNITLYLEPRVVEYNGSATLRCSYDLEGEPLYSVKWYRGSYEFYRYSPTEIPQTKVFPHTAIHVDLSVSNESQVVLRKVGFNLSGNFSCEVTADAPTFSTKFATQQMLVVALPESRPVISTEKARYKVLDTLRANCTSPPSEPAAKLQFFLNNLAVDRGEIKHNKHQDLTWTELSVEFQLFPSHFSSGRLMLRCVAQVAGMYHFDSEVELANGKEPVPARVRSRAHKASSESTAIVIFLLVYFSIR